MRKDCVFPVVAIVVSCIVLPVVAGIVSHSVWIGVGAFFLACVAAFSFSIAHSPKVDLNVDI